MEWWWEWSGWDLANFACGGEEMRKSRRAH